jgi:hypothetical protein
MNYIIVKSADGTLYNLLSVDEDRNQTIAATSESLPELKQHESVSKDTVITTEEQLASEIEKFAGPYPTAPQPVPEV